MNTTPHIAYSSFVSKPNGKRETYKLTIPTTCKENFYVDLMTGALGTDSTATKLAVYNLWLE